MKKKRNQFVEYFSKRIVATVLVLALFILQAQSIYLTNASRTENETYYYMLRQNTVDNLRAMLIIGATSYKINLAQDGLIKTLAKGLAEQQKNLNDTKATLKNYQTIDLKAHKRILEANVKIINTTLRCTGSGTVIKIKNKYYILTCAHLIEQRNEELYILVDGKEFPYKYFPIDLLKIDRADDLALFSLKMATVKSYLQVSDIAPTPGSSLTVVGNPSGVQDILTNGILCKISEEGDYVFSNTIFFGNSGGAVLYKNQIVGVVSRICAFRTRGINSNYGLSSTLEQIKRFLLEYTS